MSHQLPARTGAGLPASGGEEHVLAVGEGSGTYVAGGGVGGGVVVDADGTEITTESGLEEAALARRERLSGALRRADRPRSRRRQLRCHARGGRLGRDERVVGLAIAAGRLSGRGVQELRGAPGVVSGGTCLTGRVLAGGGAVFGVVVVGFGRCA